MNFIEIFSETVAQGTDDKQIAGDMDHHLDQGIFYGFS